MFQLKSECLWLYLCRTYKTIYGNISQKQSVKLAYSWLLDNLEDFSKLLMSYDQELLLKDNFLNEK